MSDAEADGSRTARVEESLIAGWPMFEKLAQGVRRALFVGPSLLSGWPIDAAEALHAGRTESKLVLTFAPTIGIASAARARATGRVIERVLLLSYGGADLPGVQREVADVRAIYGSRVTFVNGSEATKHGVMQQLSEGWDVIHFCGHGEFDYLEPMQSKIYFHERGPDGVLTAADIMQCGTIANPIVVLSACSSALVLPNGSNNFLGLAGALLRTGATAIVGARWPIADDTGAAFSKHVHSRLAAGDEVDQAVAFAKSRLRNEPTDEWSAFMTIGG